MTKNRAEGSSERRPHEEFLELCAVSTSGELTEAEQMKLRGHLASCAECREALEEFEAAAQVGIPLLSSELSATEPESPAGTGRIVSRTEEPAVDLSFANRNGHKRTQVNWNYVWLPFAACLVLTVALGIYLYHSGTRHGLEVAQVMPSSPAPGVDAIEQQMSDAGHDREILLAQLAERDRVIRELRSEIARETASLDAMRTAQADLERSIQSGSTEKQHATEDRASLAQKLDAAETSLERIETELTSVRQQRSQDQARAVGLEAKISDLTAQLRNRDETVEKQQELLAHDRDIRELMGARDLYIAEVYDVERDGATQKPFGRVFYTKGKSLIFYAYDLGEQAGIKNANTFQAWGRRGPDRQKALSLGIFYEDNANKKRWVLKTDDAKALQQIDAVFVTVEPNGGSQRPSGKPLLFAYLKIDPNHP
jgi:predicted  nucleic acid-binding Zn-ribbon protein